MSDALGAPIGAAVDLTRLVQASQEQVKALYLIQQTLLGPFSVAALTAVVAQLPTTNPGGTGQLWVDAGVLKVT